MSFERVEERRTGRPLPPFSQVSSISRLLSTSEYYHASVGSSFSTLEDPREATFVLRGEGRLNPQQWQGALERAAAVNPGARLRLVGKRRGARWQSDGQPPRLRVLERCDWDAQSNRGAEFIRETPLPLETGPTVELIVAPQSDGRSLVVLRTLHAVMDGGGCLHFLKEIFRALRGETLLGSNAAFSDVDLMRSIGATHSTSRRFKTTWLTGEPEGDEIGDEFRRICLGPPKKNLLARVAAAMAEFAQQRSDLPAVIALPVDLRRHEPSLLSTLNYANLIFVRVEKGEGAEDVRCKLQGMLEQRMDAVCPRFVDIFKILPMPWMDRLVSRTRRTYRKNKPLETALISNLGRSNSAELSAPGFRLQDMAVLALPGSSPFATLVGLDDRVEMMLNMPKVLASNGRFDAFVAHLQRRLAE